MPLKVHGDKRAVAVDTGGLLEHLYRAHRSMLTNYVKQTFGAGPPEPADVTHAAFAKFAALRYPETIRNPVAYLKKMAANIVIEDRRKVNLAVRTINDVAVLQEYKIGASPEEIILSQRDLDRLAAAIEGLKPKYRVALLMHRMDGASFVDIARAMNISQSGARLLVETALARCAAVMDPYKS